MIITVVIPAYNSGNKLSLTLARLLDCDTDGLDEVEVIVVDDGSPQPLKAVVAACAPRPRFSIRCLRQENSGPAKARNSGFRAARGELIIFLDDDILCESDFLQRHVTAHSLHPRTVIFGRCPLVDAELRTPLGRYVNTLDQDDGHDDRQEFRTAPVVASGQISVERVMFDPVGAVYHDELRTPAAEEYELSARLLELGIPVLLATRLSARHNHSVTLENMCRQVYKHAFGCAEAAAKCPATRSLPAVRGILAANTPTWRARRLDRILWQILKRIASAPLMRTAIKRVVQAGELVIPNDRLMAPLYRILFGAHMVAGVRDGTRLFGRSNSGSCAGAQIMDQPRIAASDLSDNYRA